MRKMTATIAAGATAPLPREGGDCRIPAPFDAGRRARTLCGNEGCWRQLCADIGCSVSFCCYVCESRFFCDDDTGPKHGPACSRQHKPDWRTASRAHPTPTLGSESWVDEASAAPSRQPSRVVRQRDIAYCGSARVGVAPQPAAYSALSNGSE